MWQKIKEVGNGMLESAKGFVIKNKTGRVNLMGTMIGIVSVIVVDRLLNDTVFSSSLGQTIKPFFVPLAIVGVIAGMFISGRRRR